MTIKHYRLGIEVDIVARDPDQALRRMLLLCTDIQHRSWVTDTLPDSLNERLSIQPRKDTP